MLQRISTIFFILILFTAYSAAQTKKSDPVLAQFDNQKITLEDFEKAYAKSGTGSGNAAQDSLPKLKNFLNLYVEYRMKLQDGLEKGLEKDPEILQELDHYREQIANSLYLEKDLILPNLKKLYERRKWEFRASHIMFKPEKGDTAATLKLANAVLDSLMHGADFSKMAARYSQDKFTAQKGGDIYYFTAGLLPLNFENAVYETPVGQVYPKVLKSNFGFHIIKVTEKRKRVLKIRASHILVNFIFDGKEDKNRAKEIIDTVYQKLKNGEDFGKLVHEYSTDKGSVVNNGDIGFFSRNQTVRPFDEAAFNLKNVGDISGIVETQFGYHIIKLTGKEPYPSFEQDKEELMNIFKREQYNERYDELVDSLINKYNVKENAATVNYLASKIDTTKTGFDIAQLSDSIKNSILFTLPDKKFTVNDFIGMVQSLDQQENQQITSLKFRQALKKLVGKYLITKTGEDVFKNDSNFINLLNDYKNGTIIFKLQQQEVWNKIKLDSADLYNYYEQHTKKYMWPDRVQFTELFTKSDSLIHHYQKLINEGENFDTLCTKYTERWGYKTRGGKWDLKERNFNDLYQKAWTMVHSGDLSDIYKNSDGYSIIRLDLKDPAHIKTFEEAKPEVSADYQELKTKELQEAYTDRLMKKYKPVINYEELEKVFKHK